MPNPFRQQMQEANFRRYGEPTNMDELGLFVVKAIEAKGVRVDGLAWDLVYRPKISNTHCCPIQGVQNFSAKDDLPKGYPGWQGRIWIRYGEVIESIHPTGCKLSGSDWLTGTNTFTGSGGYGAYSGPWQHIAREHHIAAGKGLFFKQSKLEIYSYDYKIFEDDWPAVKKWREKIDIVNSLKHVTVTSQFGFSSSPKPITHKFYYGSAKTVDEELDFLQKLQQA